MALLLIAVGGLLAAIPATLRPSGYEIPSAFGGAAWIAIALTLVVLCFYFWPLYSTYYTVSQAGLEIRYGPWVRRYPWSDFVTAYWQKGMFATRIGWPSVTPCVRLTDCVLLKRKARGFGLYLTPNEPKVFLQRIGEFAPQLISELML